MMRKVLSTILFLLFAVPAHAQSDLAVKFGSRESIGDMSISPDGTKVAYLQPIPGQGSALLVTAVDGGISKAILKGDGKPSQLRWCSWASNTRLVCELYGLSDATGMLLPFTRLVAINADGSEIKTLGQHTSSTALGIRQFDGEVIGWNASDDGQILMSRTYVPESTMGTHLASNANGLGVDRINTLTLRSSRVEPPKASAARYIADSNGVVRIMHTEDSTGDGTLTGITRYYYRMAENRDWKPFSEIRAGGEGLVPVAIDSAQNIAFAFGRKDGRLALSKVSLDGQLTNMLVLANDKVDIDTTITLGRSGRVIGAEFVTDKRETVIFDPEYNALAKRLGKALPGLPLVRFVDASRDEKRLLLFAGSDTDPGRYYIYDKSTKRLNEIALARPQLEGVVLSPVKPILYPAADGTMIPAYLTLPPGRSGKGLPALVMPHGGPSARDEWGFDWLSQYFAAQGYAVLQPNFRGSSGYGDDWYQSNGFKSWRTAIGDVNDAGRWMIAQGIAQPKKLAIFGWSYGGYAALQSGVLDPDLFKAVVAVAPVTDLRMLINQSKYFTNSKLVANEVGSGDHIIAGSPLQQVSHIKAPVLMFSGDQDLNVDIAHARAMDAALRKQGKESALVTFPGLDHYLTDSVARASLLSRSHDFLTKALGL